MPDPTPAELAARLDHIERLATAKTRAEHALPQRGPQPGSWAFDQEARQAAARRARIAAAADKAAADDRWREKNADRLAAIEAQIADTAAAIDAQVARGIRVAQEVNDNINRLTQQRSALAVSMEPPAVPEKPGVFARVLARR
jgi:hypothetical protein